MTVYAIDPRFVMGADQPLVIAWRVRTTMALTARLRIRRGGYGSWRMFSICDGRVTVAAHNALIDVATGLAVKAGCMASHTKRRLFLGREVFAERIIQRSFRVG